MTLTYDEVNNGKPKSNGDEIRERIIKRAALEFKDGMYGILLTCGFTVLLSVGALFLISESFIFTALFLKSRNSMLTLSIQLLEEARKIAS